MKPVRVVVVDDEPLARERVSALVAAATGLELVGEGANGIEALDLITALEPDLLFIDVEMPELSGFGVVAALESGKIPEVVFITAYEQYALKAFEVGAIDYLQKPVTPARFAAAADRALARLHERSAAEREALHAGAAEADRERGARTRFVVRQGNSHHFVSLESVDWCDVAHNYVRLHCAGRVHFWRGTMRELEGSLDAQCFIRIHRSILIAADRVVRAKSLATGGFLVELRDGTKVKGSRQYAERVRRLIERQ